MLGVGRGAFAYELARMGKPIEESRERFDESLNVLLALLAREEVSWDGKYYQFAPITVMPRPRAAGSPAIMIAALIPEAIEASARRGFHIQTTPLNASVDKMREQVDAFKRGKAASGDAGRDLRLAVMRVCCVAKDDADARRKSISPTTTMAGSRMYLRVPVSLTGARSKRCRSSSRKTSSRDFAHLYRIGDDRSAESLRGTWRGRIDHEWQHRPRQPRIARRLERFSADVMPLFSAAKVDSPVMQATGT